MSMIDIIFFLLVFFTSRENVEPVEHTKFSVKDTVMNDSAIPAKFKRKEIVRRLNDSGIFKVKNAIQICADTLDITIATIYMHIRNLDTN